MNALFGTQYFGFIAGAYGITALVLGGLVLWVLIIQRNRRVQLERLEQAGLRRARRDG